ncbi:MAG: hypothetical protein R6X02_13000 [Enhygromyxa sp.]
MSTVHLIASEIEPAANTAPRCNSRRDGVARAATARGFLVQLVAREAPLLERGAIWLRSAGRQLASLGPSAAGPAATCERLALETLGLREQLKVLAHHLVARWNRTEGRRRLDVSALLEQPVTGAAAELVSLHEQHAAGPTPWVELAVLRPLEQMLAGVVPLAIDVAVVDDSDLAAAARLFGAREQRARALADALAELVAADPRRAPLVAEAEEQAIAIFTKLLTECAKVGPELDCWRYGFVC